MANPALLIGLVAGYTVGAVLTALLVAEDPTGTAADGRVEHLAGRALPAPCANALRRSRRAVHCLRPAPERLVTSLRR